MNAADLKAALDALALTECDMDDVRIVEDGDAGRLILARQHIPREKPHLVAVHMQGERVTRLTLSSKLAGALSEFVEAAPSEDE